MNKAAQILTLIALFGATGYHTLAPEPPPEPEPPIFADNDPNIPPPVCVQECGWVGDKWVCWQVCY